MFFKTLLKTALSVLACFLLLPFLSQGQPCAPVPSGLVSWWPGEGNALDQAGTNNGTLGGNTTYVAGRVGQAFVLDGSGDGVAVGNPPELQLQTFTIEAWIKRSNASRVSLDPVGDAGIFEGSWGGYAFALFDDGRLFLSKIGYSYVASSLAITDTLNFHHVAVTKTGTNVIFYLDGAGQTVAPYDPGFVFNGPSAIGARGGDLFGSFLGAIDELAVYNRPLSASEIQAIYNAGSAGKCGLPPTITNQPASQTVPAGTNVTFNVVASGTSPLSYQWRFNTADILDATNAALVLSNVQPATNGSYAVVVSNSLNSVTSAPANLSVRYAFVFGNGQNLTKTQYTFINSVTIQLQTFFPSGTLFYTLDGSPPSFAASQYGGPFAVNQSSLLRVLTYRADFLQAWESDPITLTIIPTYTLTLTTAGGGTLAALPASGPYVSNTVVNLTATPASGWTLLDWLGDASGPDPATSLTMDRNRLVQARFGTALNTTVAGSGSVTLVPPGGVYPFGTVVRLYANPQPGNYFALWGNAGSGSSNPLSFTVTNANPTISSLFAPLGVGEFALTVLPNGLGQVTVSPATNRYTSSQHPTLTATPAAGQEFLGWSGDATGTDNPLSVAMNQSKVITANFTRRPGLSVAGGLNGLNDQGFRLTLTGDYGGHYRLDGSTNLVDWVELMTLTNSYGTAQFTDPAATTLPGRFYKAVTVP